MLGCQPLNLKIICFIIFFLSLMLQKFPMPSNCQKNTKLIRFCVVNEISRSLNVFQPFSPFPKFNLSRNILRKKSLVNKYTSSQTCKVWLRSKLTRGFFLSALVYIFRKTEADDNRGVATCKAAYQLYVQTVRLLEQGVNYFFFYFFFLLRTLIASLSDKRALIKDWTKTSTIYVFSNTF